jgi:hypothetical protein
LQNYFFDPEDEGDMFLRNVGCNSTGGKLLTCWFLLNYFFNPEDGGDMFLRNVSFNSTDYTASYPRRRHSS